MTLIKVKSDNFEGLLTPQAYEALVLCMSTGDYCTHKSSPIIMPETDDRAIQAIEHSEILMTELNEGN